MMMWRWIFLTLLVYLPAGVRASESLPVIRVAALSYGSANWELQVMKSLGIDHDHGFELDVVPVQSPAAAAIAIQGGSADVTVQDWLWVLRQYQSERIFRFYPFSTATGALMVPKDGAQNIADLSGLPVGVAGGAADKGWVLLCQWYLAQTGSELARQIKPKFASPPLLNQLALSGELMAVLTYWHYAARLEAQGFTTLMSVTDILAALGVDEPVAMLGWVFADDVTHRQPALVDRFLLASKATKQRLLIDDEVWDAAAPWMRAGSEDEMRLLIDGFRAGIPGAFDDRAQRAISRVAAIYLQSQASPVAAEGDRATVSAVDSAAAQAALLSDAGLFVAEPAVLVTQ